MYNATSSDVGGLARAEMPRVVKWMPPREGFYKVNSDAAVDGVNRLVGVGLVIRGHHGGVRAASAQHLHVSFSPLIAEAMPVLRGLDFAIDTGLLLVILESDALGWLPRRLACLKGYFIEAPTFEYRYSTMTESPKIVQERALEMADGGTL
ncbi:hypothetical protein Dsin_000651 [Dipteronia sinensis]|uniref:RNase H type-1 domain-containing protein n=1 Tax=Dipteronia sinensis TaxID=43782 RepID=A0AAE0B3U7_9ROSI|nr:hypothetical protein Dsin_000651 [Dipteronia sinensis]